jgi:crossover junction endodeoxyribonuclease RuvC
MIILGVDPGRTGGIAALIPGAAPALHVMPTIGRGIDFVALCAIFARHHPAHVIMERAQAFPKAGASGMFNYGASYWGVQAICAALRIPLTGVTPAKWHRALITGRDGTPKDRALRTCVQLFPSVDLIVGKGRKPHAGLVDALLIAEYGRRALGVQPGTDE